MAQATMMDSKTPDDGGTTSPARAAMSAKVRARLGRNPMVSRIETPLIDIYARHDFASSQECARLRNLIDADAQPSSLFAGSADPDWRTSSSCHLDPWEATVEAVSDRICALMGLAPALGETLQGQRYHVGQQYKAHYDFFPVNTDYWPRMRDSGGQRCWTAMVYLSGVESGGETHFPHAGFMVPPREGMLLVWSNLTADGAPNEKTAHAAMPVGKGTKYVVTKWFRERPWTP